MSFLLDHCSQLPSAFSCTFCCGIMCMIFSDRIALATFWIVSDCHLPYLLKCKTFPINLVLKYVRSSQIQIWSIEPDCAKLDCAEPNKGLHCQTVMCKRTREQSTTKVNLQQSFLGTLPIIELFKEAQTLQKPALFPFSGKEMPNLVDPLDQAILCHWTP